MEKRFEEILYYLKTHNKNYTKQQYQYILEIEDILNKRNNVTLREYITQLGYTTEEWDKCVGELCKNGIGRGCYQDYTLLTNVIGWLCNYDSKSAIKE